MVTGKDERFLIVGEGGWDIVGIEQIARLREADHYSGNVSVAQAWRLPEVWGATEGVEPEPVRFVGSRDSRQHDERDGAPTYDHNTLTAMVGDEAVASAPYSINLDA